MSNDTINKKAKILVVDDEEDIIEKEKDKVAGWSQVILLLYVLLWVKQSCPLPGNQNDAIATPT